MNIIEITADNLDLFLENLIRLNDDFLEFLGVSKNRSKDEKSNILKNMVRKESPTKVLGAKNTENQLVGFCYFNFGTGYSCGGNYIWINSIYIEPDQQGLGVGRKMLLHLEDIAKEYNVKLLISMRDPKNIKSQKLFEAFNFDQELHTTMTKMLDFD